MSAGRFRQASLIPRPHTLWPLFLLLSVGFQLPMQAQEAAVSTVAFTLNFPGSEPEHYAISVASTGHSVYQSNGKLTNQSDGDPFRLEFQISEATHARIFDLAGRAHDFEGQIDSGRKNIASTGAKTLSYKDAQKNTQATYNYSSIPAVQELTALFQNLSTTLEFGRRLEFYHRYQKLALDDELKTMERMSLDKNLAELPAVAPILQSIVQDASVMKTARARASRLLDLANSTSAH
jgi:hypothetical protein